MRALVVAEFNVAFNYYVFFHGFFFLTSSKYAQCIKNIDITYSTHLKLFSGPDSDWRLLLQRQEGLSSTLPEWFIKKLFVPLTYIYTLFKNINFSTGRKGIEPLASGYLLNKYILYHINKSPALYLTESTTQIRLTGIEPIYGRSTVCSFPGQAQTEKLI